MSARKTITVNELDVESQAELVKEIRKNVASLKLSIDQILVDMDSIRNAKLEILNKVGLVKNDSVANSAQLQLTVVKAKRIVRKSEENKRKLELVLKKMNDFNITHTSTIPPVGPADTINGNNVKHSSGKKHGKVKRGFININSGREKIRLLLLDNNKYLVAPFEPNNNTDEVVKGKSCFEWDKDSALKELQWVVKMKLYKLRHHYDRLSYDQDLEERLPLPVSWGQTTKEYA